jgi:hypothetical protein
MSQQHDWQKYQGYGSMADESQAGAQQKPADVVIVAEPVASADADGPEAGSTEAGSTEADSTQMAPPSAEAEQLASATSRDQGISGWSGRAVGPLSSLLPGGAVDLTAGEESAEPSEADDHEPAAAIAADDAQPDEVAAATPASQLGQTGTDDRWHAVLVGFVDDPRGSIEAARALIDEDIAAHIALLTRRKEAMHAWQADKGADTEALRLALVDYRDLRKRLADVADALAA